MLMGVGKAPRSMGPESVSRRIRPGHMGQVRAIFFSGFCGSSLGGGREYLGEPTPRAKAEVRALNLRGGTTTGSNNFVESWMNWSVAGNGRQHWVGLLERSTWLR